MRRNGHTTKSSKKGWENFAKSCKTNCKIEILTEYFILTEHAYLQSNYSWNRSEENKEGWDVDLESSQAGAAQDQETTASSSHLHKGATWVSSQCPGILVAVQWKPPVNSGQPIVFLARYTLLWSPLDTTFSAMAPNNIRGTDNSTLISSKPYLLNEFEAQVKPFPSAFQHNPFNMYMVICTPAHL